MSLKKNVLVTIGTKAQFIKMAPVLRAMEGMDVSYGLIYTGQHSETFDLLEKTFGTSPVDEILVPNVEVATKQGMLGWSFKFWQAALKKILLGRWKEFNHGVVHGDTISALYCAMAMRLAGMTVVHIEAGLRSKNLWDPFPEEIIRRMISRIASIHFAPDDLSVSNMRGATGLVINTQGNTMRDALRIALGDRAEGGHVCGQEGYALVSMHRNENLSNADVFNSIMTMVEDTAKNTKLKFVLHPATRSRLQKSEWHSRLQKNENIELLQRMDYPEFVKLIVGCSFLMTDGGSNQEEAAMLGVPTILLRKNTERMDGVGTNVVISELDAGRLKNFVHEYNQKTWISRAIDKNSPSKLIAQWFFDR